MSTLAFRLSSDGTTHDRRGGFLLTFILGGLAIAVVTWVIAYSVGIAPWLGFAKQSEAFVAQRVEPKGISVGPRTFAFTKGQRVFVSYDLHRIERGSLAVRVIQRGDLTPDPMATLVLTGEAKGRHEYRVPASGLYTIALHCLPGVNGCDVAYDATWGGLPPQERRTVVTSELNTPLGTWVQVR